MKLKYDHYYTYLELASALRDLAEGYPELATLKTIGKSGEGRDLLVIAISNSKTGPADTKPGFYIDGNHHAGECVGSMVSLYAADYILSYHGKDERATDLVDRCAFYIHPRVSPDGAEAFLTTPESMRSAPRLYPFADWDNRPGLYPADIDGDGIISLMRVKDPAGEWKLSSLDKRAMARRAPDERGGAYYRIYPEGLIRDYDGVSVKLAPARWGLDLNRNYPAEWATESVQSGSGPYPLSEPETRAVADFIVSHPNIVMGITNHTTGGVLLMPPGSRSPSAIPPHDWRALQAIGKIGTQVTGYPCISIFEDFHIDKSNWSHGATDDWLYLHRGILSYTTELWNFAVRAGVTMWPRARKSDEEQEQDFVKMLQWCDKNMDGKGFREWTPFNHPQLGPVEIGGWDSKFLIQNAPPRFLEAECEKLALWFTRTACALPRLELRDLGVAEIEKNVYEVSCVVSNVGYLPTSGSEMALQLKMDLPTVAKISGTGFQLLGPATQPVEHLKGWLNAEGQFWMGYYFGMSDLVRERKLKWLIAAKGTFSGKIVVKSVRAGTAEVDFDSSLSAP